MKAGINLLFLKPGLAGGTETYTVNMLQAMKDLNRADITYYIFCSTELDLSFLSDNPQFIITRFNRVSRSLPYRFFFEQLIFPFRIKKYRLDVMHSFGYIGPAFIKNHLVTIHDTNVFAQKDTMPFTKRLLLPFFLKLVAKNCRHIIAVSNFSKSEIIKNLHVPALKISVVYEACKHNILQHNSVLLPGSYSYLAGTRYFVALSSNSPHKNIQTLLAAFKKALPAIAGVKLVLIGHLPPGNSLKQYITGEGLSGHVITTGFVDDATLLSLFKNAFCFVFPSLYEGFGLPLLEAQSAGLPVISSNMGSLPEIGGNSALYFNAMDADELAAVMTMINSDEEKRMNYIKWGFENIKKFSWQKAAFETIELYDRYK
jgi:glycosyltransferase involved in cell wall biosynthesis